MTRFLVALALALSAPAPSEASLTPARSTSSTAYCTGHTTASGRPVRFGSVALPSRSHLAWLRPVYIIHGVRNPNTGRVHRWFVGEDIIGWGSRFDIYLPSCSAARYWGRRTIAYRVWR